MYMSLTVSLPLLIQHKAADAWPVAKVEKVKCTLVQTLRIYTGHMAHRESRGIALLFLDHGTRRG